MLSRLCLLLYVGVYGCVRVIVVVVVDVTICRLLLLLLCVVVVGACNR